MNPQVPAPESLPLFTTIEGFLFDGSVKIRNETLESREQSIAAIEAGHLAHGDVLQNGFPEYNDAIIAMYSLSILLEPKHGEHDIVTSMDEYFEVGNTIYNLKQFIKYLPLLQGLANKTDQDVILDDNLRDILSGLLELGVHELSMRIEAILVRIRTSLELDINNTIARLREMTYLGTEREEL